MYIQPWLGVKLKELRKKAGISQFDLEVTLGLSHGSISKIESNKVNPTKETLLKIVNTLDVGLIKSAAVFNFRPEKTAGFIDSVRYFWNLKSADDVLDYAVQELPSLVGLPAAIIFKYNGKHIVVGHYTQSSFNCIKQQHKDELTLLLKDFSVSPDEKENVIVQAFLQKKVLHSDDFRNITFQALPVAYSIPIAKRFGFLSGIAHPIIVSGEVFGVMLFINAEKRDISYFLPLTETYVNLVSDVLLNIKPSIQLLPYQEQFTTL